jgi:glycosyltransferase involved in cell wall biosynthesis
MDLSRYDWLTRFSYRLECLLSSHADLIIVNSIAGREYALCNGFPADKTIVIPNGIDINRFSPDHSLRRKVRAEWLISDDDILIGLVARLDPMKGHPTFIKAASLIASERKDVKFVCIGDGPLEYKKYLVRIAIDNGIEGRLIWADARRDITSVYNALDVAALSSSYGEGFPNVIGEAMACEVPCLVTDVGDASWIVGETGVVVKPRDPNALAAGMIEILENIERKGTKKTSEARKRICEHFDVETMVAKTVKALSGAR